jgi:hypothetical protein
VVESVVDADDVVVEHPRSDESHLLLPSSSCRGGGFESNFLSMEMNKNTSMVVGTCPIPGTSICCCCCKIFNIYIDQQRLQLLQLTTTTTVPFLLCGREKNLVMDEEESLQPAYLSIKQETGSESQNPGTILCTYVCRRVEILRTSGIKSSLRMCEVRWQRFFHLQSQITS